MGTIYKLRDKQFETPVDPERGNFDYLLFADLDMSSDEVRAELNRWGDWIVQTLGIDGFRFDAAKHIRFFFFNDWLDHVRATAGRDLFAVGEYWTPDSGTLGWFIQQTGRRMSVFDFRLHFNLRDASRGGGSFDMTRIFDGTQVRQDPALAVTFVDNHDSYREDAVEDWFKPLAYALILLREGGQPCVFYPDYYGAPGRQVASADARPPVAGAAGPRLRPAKRLLRSSRCRRLDPAGRRRPSARHRGRAQRRAGRIETDERQSPEPEFHGCDRQ